MRKDFNSLCHISIGENIERKGWGNIGTVPSDQSSVLFCDSKSTFRHRKDVMNVTDSCLPLLLHFCLSYEKKRLSNIHIYGSSFTRSSFSLTTWKRFCRSLSNCLNFIMKGKNTLYQTYQRLLCYIFKYISFRPIYWFSIFNRYSFPLV